MYLSRQYSSLNYWNHNKHYASTTKHSTICDFSRFSASLLQQQWVSYDSLEEDTATNAGAGAEYIGLKFCYGRKCKTYTGGVNDIEEDGTPTACIRLDSDVGSIQHYYFGSECKEIEFQFYHGSNCATEFEFTKYAKPNGSGCLSLHNVPKSQRSAFIARCSKVKG